jgi:hypothetical protein
MSRAMIVLGFALAGVACHAADSSLTTADAGAGPTIASSAATPTGTASGPGIIDVCAILSTADMAQASGSPIEREKKGDRGECTYERKELMGLEYIVRVVVLHGTHIGGSKQDASNYMKVMRATDGIRRLAPAVDIPGLGDDATVVAYSEPKTPKDFDSIVALARKGDSIVEMIHARGVKPEQVAETAKKALPKVLAAF